MAGDTDSSMASAASDGGGSHAGQQHAVPGQLAAGALDALLGIMDFSARNADGTADVLGGYVAHLVRLINVSLFVSP